MAHLVREWQEQKTKAIIVARERPVQLFVLFLFFKELMVMFWVLWRRLVIFSLLLGAIVVFVAEGVVRG